MGDRFVVIRSNSTTARNQSAMQAIRNAGDEKMMREELAQAVGGLVSGASKTEDKFSDAEMARLVKAADIVTRSRTGVLFGNVSNGCVDEDANGAWREC